MYSDAGVMNSKPQVAAFLNFVLSNIDQVVLEVGYFPASTESLSASKTAWLEAMGQ
jgi:ABC-type phosphate transport system substrate-binding protein